MTIEAGEDAGHGFRGAAGVDFDECVALVGRSEVRVDGSLEGCLGEIAWGTTAEFV